MTRRLHIVALAVVSLTAALAVPLPGAYAVQQVTQNQIVGDFPTAGTPNVLDGQVDAVAQVGNRIILGGTFTQAQNSGDTTTTYVRNNILAFDATTGVLDQSFVPALDGQVTALAAAPDGTSVYVGGAFNNVNGVFMPSVARLGVTDGAAVAGFKPPVLDAIVQDLKLNNGTLYLGGFFKQAKKAGVVYPRTGLAALSATNGDVLSTLTSTVAGSSNGGVTQVYKIDITPDGRRMVVIGNFSTIDGQDRNQVALFDLTTTPATLTNWQTNAYKPLCFSSFQFYVRDVEFSPDGAYFVIGATGGYGSGPPSLCDSTSRWETGATGTGLQPTWVDYTGGDTTYAVGVTGAAVYVGGHMRWQNNPFRGDAAGAGAVSRQGIGALDPANGLPFSWNPTRDRGTGVFDFLATSTGLWVASDTNLIAGTVRDKIAFFPLSKGKPAPDTSTGSLPGGIYGLGRVGANPNSPVLYRVNAGGPSLGALDDGGDWAADTSTAPAPYHNSGSTTASYTTVANVDASVPSTTPVAVFSTERTDPSPSPEMSWQFPVAASTPLSVRLYFANRCNCTRRAGSRIFDVSIDGNTVLNRYDVVANIGDQRGVMKSFPITSDGTVNIDFKHETGDPLIDAIEIVRTDVPPTTGTPAIDAVSARSFNGTTAGSAKQPDGGGQPWHLAHGAVMIGNTVYTGWADGNLYGRTYDGSTWGPAVSMNTADQIVPMTAWHQVVPTITSMFFWGGRLYYTRSGANALYYRYFTPESGVVGAMEFTAAAANLSDINWSNLQGTFVANGKFYYVTGSDGVLHRSDFGNGLPVAGTSVPVSGPALDGVDWRAHGLFLSTFGTVNQPPVASFSSTCSGATCSFDASASSDDGTISSYAWNFGDGTTGTGKATTHAYVTAKTYTVTLTVTDNDGATSTTTRQVTPQITNVAPTAAFSGSCSSLQCSLDASASGDTDGTIVSYAWDFGDGTSGSGRTTTHGYAAAGTYHVTLTVTDDSGGTGSTTHDLTATAPAVPISFVGRSTFNANASVATVTVPTGVQAGDALVLVEDDNTNTTAVTGPQGVTGWSSVTSVPNGAAVTRLWSKVAAPGDAGATVTLTASATLKMNVELLAYHGTSGTSPVAALASGTDSALATTHVTPTAQVSSGGSWVVSFWDDKSSTTTAWTAPAGQIVRGTSIGSGTAHMSSLATDGGQTAPTGSAGGLAATTDDSAKATMLTVVLAPLG